MEAPKRIGPYEVVREIGRGGMGIVYLAKEPVEGELFALKVLPETWSSDPSRLERFQREAATVMKVRHPNIVPIYSIGRADGVRFIAMKYIEGKPLDQLIREQATPKAAERTDATVVLSKPWARGEAAAAPPPAPAPSVPANVSDFVAHLGPPISWCRGDPVATSGPPIGSVRPRQSAKQTQTSASRAGEPEWIYQSVVIVETIARALQYLHDRGITHRDVKPANIMIDGKGQPWLADFGLVRDLDTRVTSEAEGLVGTVQYIAPEQILCSQSERDSRSDLYALGVTLYELVTLRRPFDGGDPVSILHVAASEAPTPPRELNPRLTAPFEEVIQKAMAKDPDVRYQSGKDLATDLERLRTFRKPAAAAAAPQRPKTGMAVLKEPRFIYVVLFLILLVVGLVEYLLDDALKERRRLRACKAEADIAFDCGDYPEAEVGYRLYLKLNGDDALVPQRLRFCQDRLRPTPPR
jgi:eukaryotic-like serine/threonine-protein kinase